MDAEPSNIAPDKLPSEAEEALAWGEGRRQDAQLAMRAVLTRLERERFSGQRLPAGQISTEFEDAAGASGYFQGALLQYLQEMGADVQLEPGTADSDVNAVREPLPRAPWEEISIAGTVPSSARAPGGQVVAQIIEACTEMTRVLLAVAVVAAAEECKQDESVIVRLRKRPQVGGSINGVTGNRAGAVIVSCVVHTSGEPRASYLLGTAYGEPKPRKLVWGYNFIEQIYGPDRLRWRDLRSPDFEPGPDAPPKAVAS